MSETLFGVGPLHGVTIYEDVNVCDRIVRVRPWRERLFTRPWRPWIRQAVQHKPTCYRLDDHVFVAHPSFAWELKRRLGVLESLPCGCVVKHGYPLAKQLREALKEQDEAEQ